jgi:hypothetical protein
MNAVNKTTSRTKHCARPPEIRVEREKFVILQNSVEDARAEPSWEPCARCRRYYRLNRVGRLWLQPLHDCLTAEEEPMRT